MGKCDRREGHFMIKKGTIADMLYDSRMLCGYDFDKVIPSFQKLNSILQEGYWGRLVEWDSITIEIEEYNEIVQALLNIPLDRPYRNK